VHPADADFIIAPDVYNNVVKVTRDGGATWTTDAALTNLVTEGGTVMMRDDSDERMQVTHIAFDPYHHERIYIGTRDNGIIASYDQGATWYRIWYTAPIAYMTGMAFSKDDIMYVSTYGRGLWKLQPIYMVTTIFVLLDFELTTTCQTLRCRVKELDEPRQRRPDLGERIIPRTPWPRLRDAAPTELLLVTNGSLNGLVTSKERVTGVSLTPGAHLMRYLSPDATPSELAVTNARRSTGYAQYNEVVEKAAERQLINGLVLKGGVPVALLTGGRALTAKDLGALEATMSKAARQDKYQPYLILTTSEPVGGALMLGEDNKLHIFARGFAAEPSATVEVTIDGQLVKDLNVKAEGAGTFRIELQVPKEIGMGDHEVVVAQRTRIRTLTAKGSFRVPVRD
jgi:hypothetical protein